MMNEQDREAFEHYWVDRGSKPEMHRTKTGYRLPWLDWRWKEWQAALAHRDTSHHPDQTQQACPLCRATHDEIERVKAEVKGNLAAIPADYRVIVREGGGLPDDAASLAVSVIKVVDSHASQQATITTLKAQLAELREAANKINPNHMTLSVQGVKDLTAANNGRGYIKKSESPFVRIEQAQKLASKGK